MTMTIIANRILTMPVKLAVIGHIKIGQKGAVRKSAGGGEYQAPVKLDHILITSTERGLDNNFLPHPVMRRLAPGGELLKSVKCSLLFNDLDRNFRAQFARYDGKTLACHGDGVTAREGGVERPCSCGREAFGYSGKDKCKATATIDVVLSEQTMSGGVFRFSTTSWNSIVSLQSSQAYLFELTQGHIAGIPLVLTLLSKTATLPTGGTTKIYYMALQIDGTPEQIMTRAMQRAQFMHNNQTVIRQLAQLGSSVAPPQMEMETVEEEEEEFAGLIESDDLEEFGIVEQKQQNIVPEQPKLRRSLADIRNGSAQAATEPTPTPSPETQPPAQVQPEQKREFKRGDNVRLVCVDGTIVSGQILRIDQLRFVIDCDVKEEPVVVLQAEVVEKTWV